MSKRSQNDGPIPVPREAPELEVLATCALEIHDGTFSSNDAVVNDTLLSHWNVRAGERLLISIAEYHVHNDAIEASRTTRLTSMERSRCRDCRGLI